MSEAAQASSGKRLTLGAAFTDLGWFSWLFAFVVGAPSVLSILQEIFVEHHLIFAFQWIVDGWNDVLRVAAGVLEPLLRPLIDWINSKIDIHLVLAPHWRPLFAIGMSMAISSMRSFWLAGKRIEAVADGLFISAGALFGAISAGVLPLSGNWWVQGLVTLLPVLWMAAFNQMESWVLRLVPATREKPFSPDDIPGLSLLKAHDPGKYDSVMRSSKRFAIIWGAVLAFVLAVVVPFSIGSISSLFLGSGGGVIGLLLIVFFVGSVEVILPATLFVLVKILPRELVPLLLDRPIEELRGRGIDQIHRGLRLVGSFIAAGLILSADAIVKALAGS